MVQLSGQSAVRIYPESETEFFMTVVNARLSFDLDSKGLVTGLTLIQNGRRRQGKKYDPPILTTEEAEAYVGKYYSGELETYYLISREGGRLFIKIGTNPKSELRFVKKDEFQNPLRMSFSRNHSDAVTGFHIFAGRVRNIVFIRE